MRKLIKLVFFLLAGYYSFCQSVSNAISKGNDYYRQGAYDLAMVQYQIALKEDPDNAIAKNNMANILYRQSKFADAIKHYKAASANSDAGVKSGAFYNEGVLRSNLNQTEEAIELYKKALRIDPNDQKARENLQKALAQQKRQQQQSSSQSRSRSSSSMSQSEAEKKLDQLREKEKQLQRRLSQKGEGGRSEKDW
jgi:Ca-activated chloride channel homolog